MPVFPNTPAKLGRRAVVLGLSGAALCAPHVARAAQRRLRFGHNNTDISHFGRGGQAFADAVAADETLKAVIKIDILGNAQLGDDLTMLAGLSKGTVDGAIVASSLISNNVPEIGILNVPYIFADAGRARAMLDGPIGAEFLKLCHAKNVPVLAWGENGMRHITSNQPVRNVADLKGLKLRVPQSPIMLDGMRALGADAAPLAFGLLRGALQSGEFQAQENAISLVATAKLYEVQKYLCLTGHIYDAVGFIASSDLLEDLTEPQRAALALAARKGAAVTRQISDEAARNGIVQLKALGMTVITDIDIAGLQAAARPYAESLKPRFGAERVASLLAPGA
jgi:tripartite ATP-independent transporter DctP family solute receptor